MAQLIQFLSNYSSSANCQSAVAPVVVQGELTLAVGSGSTLTDLITPIAIGSKVPFGGQIVNEGCYDLMATITYLDGDDCSECTQDSLTPTIIQVEIPKNSAFPIPDGYFTSIQVQTIDSTNAPINVTKEQVIHFYSAYKPACPSCTVILS